MNVRVIAATNQRPRRRRSAPRGSARISTTACGSSRSAFRRCASGARTSCRWRGRFSGRRAERTGRKVDRVHARPPRTNCCATGGPATSASSRTRSSEPSCSRRSPHRCRRSAAGSRPRRAGRRVPARCGRSRTSNATTSSPCSAPSAATEPRPHQARHRPSDALSQAQRVWAADGITEGKREKGRWKRAMLAATLPRGDTFPFSLFPLPCHFAVSAAASWRASTLAGSRRSAAAIRGRAASTRPSLISQ